MHKIKFFSFFSINFFFALLTLVGCASVKEVTSDTFETGTTNWDGSIDLYRTINQKNADEKCLSQGKLVDPIAEGRLSSIDWVLRFKCIDPSVKRQRELDAFEANKREQARLKKLAEEERQQQEARRLRYEEEQKIKEVERLRQEALKAAEWERTRPQREAAKRKAMAEEEARLNSICPKYANVRNSCAEALDTVNCMRLRYGKNFSKQDHDTCFNR
jgi:hypothetical protein